MDDTNNIDELYDIDNSMGYYHVWRKIDKLIIQHEYSCIGFPFPEINEENHIITIHWIELLNELSRPYIEIMEVTDKLNQKFACEIKRCKRSIEIRKRTK